MVKDQGEGKFFKNGNKYEGEFLEWYKKWEGKFNIQMAIFMMVNGKMIMPWTRNL